MTRIIFLWMLVAAAAAPAGAYADGGDLRYSGVKGGYRIAVFTAPAVLREGPVDISVLVQDAVTGRARLDVPVTVSIRPAGRSCCGERRPATEEAATNKLFRAATFELTRPGCWQVEVQVGNPLLTEPACFEVETAAPLPEWVQLAPWVGWPFAALLLGGLHQWLVSRRPVSPDRGPATPTDGGSAPGTKRGNESSRRWHDLRFGVRRAEDEGE